MISAVSLRTNRRATAGRELLDSWARTRVPTVFIVGLLILLLLSTVPAVRAQGTPLGSSVGAGSQRSTTGFPTSVRHVVMVLFENEPRSAIQSDGGYIWSLCSTFACPTNYYAICHPSAPNYLALTSGKMLECGSDAYNSYGVNNIGELVDAKGETWASYSESMPSVCDLSSSGEYAVRHNPMAYYTSVTGSSSYCDAHILPFPGSGVAGAPSSWSSIPNFLFIDPNLLHDGHTPGGEQGIQNSDAWLKSWLPMVEQQSWYATSVIWLVYDESADSDTTCPSGLTGGVSTSNCGGHVFLAAVSPFSQGVGTYATNVDDYDVLTTTEWLLGLGNTGANDAHGITMSSLFTFSSPPPTKYSVSGWVNASTGGGLSGAQLSFSTSGSSPATTTANGQGYYQLSLPNGTYSVNVSDSGYRGGSGEVTVNGGPVTGLNFALTSTGTRTYAVSGWVNSTTGAPIANASIRFSAGSESSTTGITNSEGSYSVDLANGTYSVSTYAAGYVGSNQSLTVSGHSVPGFDFSLTPVPPTTYVVSGSVASAATGAPISGANLALIEGTENVSNSTTNATGAFAFSVPNGTYTLKVAASGFASQNENLTVSGAPLSGVDFALVPVSPPPPARQPYEVVGSVYWFPADLPVSGATVYLNATGSSLVNATTSSGAFSFAVSNGTYNLTAVASGLQGGGTEPAIVDGDNVSGIVLPTYALNMGVYEVSGSVMANGTAPLEEATVAVQVEQTTLTVQTAANGSYTLRLPNGTYTLVISAEGYAPSTTGVSVKGQNVQGVNFDLPWNPTGGPTLLAPSGPSSAVAWAIGIAVAGAFALVAYLGWRSGRDADEEFRRPPSR